MKSTVKPFAKIVEDLGVHVISTSVTGSTHYKFVVEHNGHKRFFIAPSSTSDNRAMQNFKSEIRRWMKTTEGTLR